MCPFPCAVIKVHVGNQVLSLYILCRSRPARLFLVPHVHAHPVHGHTAVSFSVIAFVTLLIDAYLHVHILLGREHQVVYHRACTCIAENLTLLPRPVRFEYIEVNHMAVHGRLSRIVFLSHQPHAGCHRITQPLLHTYTLTCKHTILFLYHATHISAPQ